MDAVFHDVSACIHKRRLGNTISLTQQLKLIDVASILLAVLDSDADAKVTLEFKQRVSDWLHENAPFAVPGEIVMFDRTNLTVHFFFLPMVLRGFGIDADDSLLQRVATEFAPDSERRPKKQKLIIVPSADAVAPIQPLSNALVVARQQLGGLSNEELLHMLVQEQATKDSMHAELVKSRKREAFHRQQSQIRGDALVIMESRVNELQSMVNYRVHGGLKGHISKWSGYNLALRRNRASAGAKAIVSVLAGDAIHGALRSKDAVYVFEHRAAAAKRTRAIQHYASAYGSLSVEPPIEPSPPPPEDARLKKSCLVIAHAYLGDGTHTEIIDRKKVHVGTLRSTWVTLEDAMTAVRDGQLRLDILQSLCSHEYNSCGLHTIVSETGQETYAIIRDNFGRLGCQDWEMATREAAGQTHNIGRLSCFNYGLDHGSGNQGKAKRVAAAVSGSLAVAYTITWCLFHQAQLMCKCLLEILDAWKWEDEVDVEVAPWPTKYFNGPSAVSNVWRSPGAAASIRERTTLEFSVDVSEQCCKRTPGRVLRARWFSIDSVEAILVCGIVYIGTIFQFLWPAASTRCPVAVAAGPGSEEEDSYREKVRSCRHNATLLLNTTLFKATLVISFTCKRPLRHFFFWGQKQVKLWNDRRSGADVYLGPTPLSMLVCEYAAQIKSDISKLLAPQSIASEEFWVALWPHVPTGCRGAANKLIIRVALALDGSWEYRVMSKVLSFPWLFLVMLESENHIVCGRRQEVARLFVSMHASELQWTRGLPSDITITIHGLFLDDMEYSATTGQMTAALAVVLLIWRSQLPFDTQSVEGMNSVLQRMGILGPRTGVGLASDRVDLIFGAPIDARECVDLHDETMEYLHRPETAHRYVQIAPSQRDVPAEADPVRVLPMFARDQGAMFAKVASVGYQVNGLEHFVRDTAHIWSFASAAGPGEQCT